MKKTIIPLMAIAAFATACQVEDLNEANQGQQNGELFTIEAAITPSTKTSLTVGPDSYKVDWDADDALSVVAKYSDGSYSGNEFTKGEGNTFSGTVTNPGDITELNVFYPYNSHYTTIDSEGYGNSYITFGSSANGVQSQTGINNTDHIDAPLYGYTTVTGGTATVTMSHASTLFEVIVTNSSDIDINITNITLTNSENKDMVGTFYINPKDGSLKSSGDTYTSPTASLNINNGTLTTGQTGKFYLTSAPFDLAASSNLTITVTANGQETEIIKTVSKATSFVAGTVNHLNVTIKEAQEIQPIEEGQYLIAGYDKNWGIMTKNFGTSGSKDFLTSLEFTDKTDEKDIDCSDFYGNQYTSENVWTIEVTENGYSIKNSDDKYLIIEETSVRSFSDTPFTLSILSNGDGTYSIANPNKLENTLRYNHTSTRFKPYDSKSSLKYVTLIPWIEDTTPRIFVEETAISAPAGSSTGSLSYRVSNANADDLTVSIKESASWITAENVPADNKISYEIQANDGIERTATIILSLSGTEDIEIPVTQLAAGEVIYTLTITPEDFPGGSYADNNGSHLLTATGSDGSEKEISIYTNQIMKQSTIQFQKDKGYFYNETSFTEIVSIELSNATGSFSMHIGDSENPTSGNEVINANNIFTPTVQANYFVVNCGNSTGKCSEIIIKFKME